MRAEIGFAGDPYSEIDESRLQMTIKVESRTEATMLRAFAARMGWSFDISSAEALVIQPVKAAT